ncbi:MAG: virulence RhuM family protein [Bacteroides sp.]|nr:virulence RhuM family protein [Bacteroides sp.]
MDKEIEISNELSSIRATQFRQWCTFVLRQFVIRGYVIDNKGMVKRHIPMTMEDWAKRIDIILEATGDAVLTDAGKITAEFAKNFAESEFERYLIIQDRLSQSDFNRFNDNLLSSDLYI